MPAPVTRKHRRCDVKTNIALQRAHGGAHKNKRDGFAPEVKRALVQEAAELARGVRLVAEERQLVEEHLHRPNVGNRLGLPNQGCSRVLFVSSLKK
jgi:hypothetical protein